MSHPLPEPYATTERLKDRLRCCTTRRELTDTAAAIAAQVKDHERLDPGGVAQIRQLVRYQRLRIQRGWVGVSSTSQQGDRP